MSYQQQQQQSEPQIPISEFPVFNGTYYYLRSLLVLFTKGSKDYG